MKTRRTLAFIIALAMCISAFQIQIFAVDYDGVEFTALDGTGNNGASQNYTKLLDGTTSTKWCDRVGATSSTTYIPYIIFKASKKVIITDYTFITGNDTATQTLRNPKDWTLYGCNDYDEANKTGGTWTAIHTVTDDDTMPAENYVSCNFTIENNNEMYQYYKLEITANHGTSLMQLSEMEIKWTVAYNITFDKNGGDTEASPQIIKWGEGLPTTNPTRTDYNFLGWYTKDGTDGDWGEEFTAESIVSDDTTVYAKWIVDLTLTAINGTRGVSDSENYDKLFDKDTGTKWCCNFSGSAYVVFKASEVVKLDKYSITTANDTSSYAGRNPMAWKLYGCMEYAGENTLWTVIDTVTAGSLPSKNETKKDFELTETTPFYQYFKLEITKTNSSNIMQISEIALEKYTPCVKHQWESKGETIAPTCTEVGYDVEYCSLCEVKKYEPNGTPAKGHSFKNGFCTVCNDYMPAENTGVDLCYEIGNAGQLYWFADKVNNENSTYASANAVLTDDIIVNSNLLTSLTYDEMSGEVTNDTSFTSWTPINGFSGKFDGKNHTISGLYFNNASVNYVGLFGSTDGYISNVGVVDSYFKGNNYVGGVCGWNNYGTITSCYNAGKVTGKDYVGGVCGRSDVPITNCYNTGTISGSDNVGGVCGVNFGATIKNCYNNGDVSGDGSKIGSVCGYNNVGTITNCYSLEKEDGLSTVGFNNGYGKPQTVDTDLFASGKICYLLNGGDTESIWHQTLGEDDFPVLAKTHSIVYASYPCSSKFSNTEEDIATVEHNFKDGICAACDGYEIPEQIDSIYQLKNAGHLYWFAQQVNGGSSDLDAVLVNDITVNYGVMAENSTDVREWTPIGNYKKVYTDTFDGQGHIISGLYFNDTGIRSGAYVGLFGYSEGTIANVGVENSYFSGYQDIGGVCGYNEGIITNCYNASVINSSIGSYVGGVCGENGYQINKGTIINCYNTGTVIGDYSIGGVCGENGSISIISNCYNTGTVSGNEDVGVVYGANSGSIENCYYLVDTADENGGRTIAQFNSGEVCYLLNGGVTNGTQAWYQTLTTDTIPKFKGKAVFYSESADPQYYNESVIGDVNSDDITDKADAVLVLKYISNIGILSAKQLAVADVNGDGKADILDAVKILSLAAS